MSFSRGISAGGTTSFVYPDLIYLETKVGDQRVCDSNKE